jgi:hypothetical protein
LVTWLHELKTSDGRSITAPYIVWSGEHIDVTAIEAMQAAKESKSPSARENAKEFLYVLLSNGPVARAEIDEAAKANGIAPATLFRAKKALNAIAEKDNSSPKGGWVWRLPEA